MGSYSCFSKIQSMCEHASIVSFDIFDTLLLRPYIKPTDLFLHIESSYKRPQFAIARIEAEENARMILAQSTQNNTGYANMPHIAPPPPHCVADNRISNNTTKPRNEITLDQIYHYIDSQYKDLYEIEKAFEAQILQPNPEMLQIWHYLKNLNKRIIVVSDMYLPKDFLESILHKNGFIGHEKLYVSSDIGSTKISGLLYEYILHDLHVKGAEILHIGDNYDADIKQAKKYKIHTLFYKKIMERFLKANARDFLLYEKMPKDLGTSILLGVKALHYHKKMLGIAKENYWESLGYEYAGVVGYAYMRFVAEEIENTRQSHAKEVQNKTTYNNLFKNPNCHTNKMQNKDSNSLTAQPNTTKTAHTESISTHQNIHNEVTQIKQTQHNSTPQNSAHSEHKMQIDSLLFIARDGYTLQKIFETFSLPITTHYVYAPRFFMLIFTLQHENDEIKAQAIIDFLAQKHSAIQDIKTKQDREKTKAIQLIKEHEETFRNASKKEFENYCNYVQHILAKKDSQNNKNYEIKPAFHNATLLEQAQNKNLLESSQHNADSLQFPQHDFSCNPAHNNNPQESTPHNRDLSQLQPYRNTDSLESPQHNLCAKNTACNNQGKIAIIDTATINFSAQTLLQDSLNHCYNAGLMQESIEVHGFYWIKWQGYREHVPPHSIFAKRTFFDSNIPQKWDFIEFLLTSPELPIKGIDSHYKPIYDTNPKKHELYRQEVYPFVSKNAVLFAEDMKEIFGTHNVLFTKELIVSYINCFCENPSSDDIAYMGNIYHDCNNTHRIYAPIFTQKIKYKHFLTRRKKIKKALTQTKWITKKQRIMLMLCDIFDFKMRGIKYISMRVFPHIPSTFSVSCVLFGTLSFHFSIGR